MDERSARLPCLLLTGLLMLDGCAHRAPNRESASVGPGAPGVGIEARVPLAPDEGVITIMGTNDIHGHFVAESATDPSGEGDAPAQPAAGDGAKLGGMQWLAGYVSAVRGATRKRYGEHGLSLLLDAGDAAQGTLISNSNEGLLAARLLSDLKYDAVISGNHAFDFGPIDRDSGAVDQCPLGSRDCDPLEALKRFASKLSCPLLGANVKGATFLKDYTLIPFMGRHIAVIGLENAGTPSTTYRMNVAKLKFTSGVDEVKNIVSKLRGSGQADVFVIVTHNGDQPKETALKDFLGELTGDGDGPVVDAVIAGHTHRVEQGDEGGIPYVQSGWGGKHFGIIELVVRLDRSSGRLLVDRGRTRSRAAIPVVPAEGSFMGEKVEADAGVARALDEAVAANAAVAGRKIGVLTTALSGDGKRDSDSEVGNFIADMMSRAADGEIAVIGSGDIRVGIRHPEGDALTYNDLFDVVPKGLQLVSVPRMQVQMLLDNLKLSIQSCGHRGALQQSGLVVYFERDCSRAVNGIDPKAKLVRVQKTSGEVLFPGGSAGTVGVVTTDFILTGGAGYTAFMPLTKSRDGLAQLKTRGGFRELIADRVSEAGTLSSAQFKVGRYVNCLEQSCPTE